MGTGGLPVLLLLLPHLRIRVTFFKILICSVWLSTRIFRFFQICIHYFKVTTISNNDSQMNSYFKMNRDYREEWLKGETENSSYPQNVNYKDFFMFLIHPTFTYQDKYPLLKRGVSFKMLFWRLLLILLAGVNELLFNHDLER